MLLPHQWCYRSRQNQFLQRQVGKVSRRNVLLLMEGFNTKVELENVGRREVMRQQAAEQMNESCKRLMEICSNNNLVIGGDLFWPPPQTTSEDNLGPPWQAHQEWSTSHHHLTHQVFSSMNQTDIRSRSGMRPPPEKISKVKTRLFCNYFGTRDNLNAI